MNTRRLGLMLALALVVVALGASCGATATPAPAQVPTVAPTNTPRPTPTPTQGPIVGGDLIVGLSHEPSGMDPHADLHKFIPIIVWPVYDTLVYKDHDGNFVPGLAASWEVSADERTYTFKLRDDVEFHDGTPFNAAAVKFSFDRIVDPDTKSRNAANLIGPYESTEIVDDYTARVHLTEPYGPFLDSISQAWLAIVSPTAVEKWGADYRLHQVGTGPFRWVEYIEKDHVTLERNPDYGWGPPIFGHQGPPYLQGITFKFISENAVRLGTVETGETNLVNFEFPPREWKTLESDPKFQTYKVPLPGMPSIYIINSSKSPTDELAVRKAILYGTDRQGLVDTLYAGVLEVAHSPQTPATLGYNKDLEGKYPYEPDKAKALLEEAGWKLGPDGVRVKDGQPLKIAIVSYGPPERHEFIQSNLKAIGFDVEIQLLAPLAYIKACRGGSANLCTLSVNASDPSMMSGFFVPGAKYDWTFYKGDDIGKLIEEGGQISDAAKRAEKYAQAQAKIMEQALTMPIFNSIGLWVASASVKGLAFDPRGDPIFYDVYLQR